MQRYRIDLSWDGTRYCGWQRQPNSISIQSTVEEAIRKIFPSDLIQVDAAGRTDAGVHALQQIASFQVAAFRSPKQVLRGINSKLPSDIVCTHVECTDSDFHPRSFSKEKCYRYRILQGELPCAFRFGHTWHIQHRLDIEQLQQVAALFVGTHDFRAFRAQGCSATSTIRSITDSRVTCIGDEIHFEVQGKGFLRHMVRIMVGTMVDVSLGRMSIEQVEKALRGACDGRNSLGQTAPAHGLWLLWTSLLDNTHEVG